MNFEADVKSQDGAKELMQALLRAAGGSPHRLMKAFVRVGWDISGPTLKKWGENGKMMTSDYDALLAKHGQIIDELQKMEGGGYVSDA